VIPQIDWGRPLGLLGLLLPVAVWLFAQRRGAPAAANTGALALWRRVALPEPPGGKRRKRRWTAALWLCLAALTLGALALGAPRRAVAADQQPWHLLLDRSPSMFLDRAGSSRFAFAVDAACAWLDEQAIAPRRRVWAWWRGDSWVVAIGERPPPAWGQVPDGPAPEPPYATRDEGHTLWITDRAPAMAPGQAGLCASGGPAVPGPVSQLGASLLEWDGSRLRSGAAGSAATVGIDAALPEALARLLRLWAKSRALRPVADASRGTSLRVTSSASAAEPVRVVVERDAWRMAVDVCGSGALAFDEHGRRLETWLSTGEEDEPARRSLVSFRPGRIDVALCPGAMDAPAMDATDPAAFAVSWGRLFDACLLPAPGVVSLAERLDAGGAVFSAPAPNPSGVARADESPAALLASLAAALALGAWALTGLRVRQE
jgi:hypothetical protein